MVWSQLIVANTVKQHVRQAFGIQRLFSLSAHIQTRISIIGSGPAGFYTAQHLLKHNEKIYVDIFDKMPVPFGLVRYGVAPDHPEVKNATATFEEVAQNPRCNFYGNVNIGHDLKTAELRKSCDAVVFAYGADDDKRLNIPGENAKGVHAARSFVGWYNGQPAHSKLSPNLSSDTAVIIGQGNVALDVARILLAPLELLQHTDISSYAVKALEASSIRRVHIIGRRGPLEVSFTIKELREMIRLPGTRPLFQADDFISIKPIISSIPRQRKRLIELMCKTALDAPTPEEQDRHSKAEREWELNFFRSPTQIITDEKNCATGIELEINELVKDDDGKLAAHGTGVFERIPCGMILRSIGYRSIKVEEGIPFDNRLGVIPNEYGRVVESPGSKIYVPGFYCSGWVKHGPVGVIAATMNEAFSTAQVILEDIENGVLKTSSRSDNGIKNILKDRGVQYVTFKDYKQIDVEEIFRGRESNKPREKITSSKEMLDVAFTKSQD